MGSWATSIEPSGPTAMGATTTVPPVAAIAAADASLSAERK